MQLQGLQSNCTTWQISGASRPAEQLYNMVDQWSFKASRATVQHGGAVELQGLQSNCTTWWISGASRPAEQLYNMVD